MKKNNRKSDRERNNGFKADELKKKRPQREKKIMDINK